MGNVKLYEVLFHYYKKKPIGRKESFYYLIEIEFGLKLNDDFKELYNDIIKYQLLEYGKVLYDKEKNTNDYFRKVYNQVARK